ncbi:zinc finger B-box domain-containing protein 1 isoform X3 [Pan paniscus]|uniref:zinc finger B-box domain-containing protein 1 isoform X3 n=1 Tax=Pan paniscus TaxID=9597 RepID=UPI002436BC5F|nr:zinc finger B-box domain-containing protein 1 isoform X3 [Pan paniscus]XP_054966620.1 zinc finger B-box domain-containing protein 1 isoform X3 [Pan paniscus]XP_054966621.1 zinc finger B-box domain-containing protein 1 isoform X3 [Pan paniscus]XP_057157937.1 zinc finger B-box domain-containing protein 1 isoform X3 [Pan paniscus]
MNRKDFVVLPWGKPGNSVKLKYRNAQELRMEKVQLEFENQEMEKKLQEFRSTRNKEKEDRESSEYYWKSGKVGKLVNQSYMMSQNKGNVKFSAGKVKLKLLKEQIQEPVKPTVNYKMANSSECEKPKINGKVCGQCENKAALLVCLECGEDYCSGCFAKIHQKGALKLHRTTLLQAKSQILFNVLDVAHQFIKDVNPDEPKEENNSTKETSKIQHKPKSVLLQKSSSEVEITMMKRAQCTKPRESLLCEGSFDEEASAQSFQEVLSQWRTGNHDDNKKQNLHAAVKDSLEECEVQTNLKIWREPLNIELKEDILSYMEKLWLKKHRRTPQEQLFKMLPDTFPHARETTGDAQCSQNENDEDSDGEETKVQHTALLLPVETLNIERPEPSLKIVELDDTYEEEFEEAENIVPYKVELADADSQQSCAFHDYQKNSFPYENGIHQHHVFNKGKRDFLNLCLRNSSTYYKDNSKAETSNTDFDNIVDPDVYSSDIEKIEESASFERNLKEKNIGLESNEKSDDSCVSLESKDTLLGIDLEKAPIEEKLSQDIKESLEFSNLHKRPSFEDSKTTKSSLLLQEIACRSKPITKQYQGLERFFIFDTNERLNLLPSHRLECNNSSTRITLAGQKSQRPSTANFPLSNSVKESSSCLSSSHPRSRSAAAQSSSRAASEISEIEYVDITDQNELSLDDTTDQHTLDNLEKELQVLRSLADTSEKLYSLTSEEFPDFSSQSLNISQISTDFLKTSHVRGPCGVEELSCSGRDTKIQSLLSLSESSTDEEEEDFLNKQHVITLPWSKST